jgi:hypothetical protein
MSEEQLANFDAAVLEARLKHLETMHAEILNEFGRLTTRLFNMEAEIAKARQDMTALREDTRIGLSVILSRLPGKKSE